MRPLCISYKGFAFAWYDMANDPNPELNSPALSMDTVNQLGNKKADTDPPYYQSSQFKEMLRRLVNVTFSPARTKWSTGEVAKLSRQAQQAAYEDAEAFLSGVNKLASANGIGEAVQIHVEYVRAGSDTAISRARTTSDYVGKILADGAKSLQANISKAGVFTRKAA
jgi:hypothetical protein